MEIQVVADIDRLDLDFSVDGWRKGLANKILHVLFILKVADHHGYKPVIPIDSTLDNIFEYKAGFKKLMTRQELEQISIIYEEQSCFQISDQQANFLEKLINRLTKRLGLSKKGFDLSQVVDLSEKQFNSHVEFLANLDVKDDFSVRGHYWHYDLMPSFSTFNKYLTFKSEILDYLREKYPTMLEDNAVAVHLRDTDFATHMREIFTQGILLDDEYYMKAMHEGENALGDNLEYHLFSDNIDRLANIFKGKNYVIHDDSEYIDLTAMFLMKNILGSNSSFSWVSSLYNKKLIIQPYCGYNYYESSGSVPYGFHIPTSTIVKKL